MSGGLSKRAVLRAGYGIVIGVLVLSAAEAYRIQASVSQEQLQIYRRYVDEEEALSILRRNLWLAGNDVRDFFISTTPEQASQLKSQLQALKRDDDQALHRMEGASDQRATAQKLRKSLNDFWAIVDPVPASMLGISNERQFAFLQQVVVPRRGELYNALIALSGADQQKLQESEREFAETRHRAASRLLLMIALSVLLSFVVARLSVGQAENLEQAAERHYAEVERTKRELQQLSARLLEIEEEGRKRLSRELHDEIGQTLALLQIEISRAQAARQGPALQERLKRARELAERSVQTIRNISVLLRPTLLDDLGLVPALQFQLEDFLRRSSIRCEFVEEGVDDHLPDSVKTCVYRVVQEALHNCEKHAAASEVRVSVRQLPECLVLEVEDNGRGFQLNEQRMPSLGSGLGLLGIRERAAIAGGSLVIDSAPGHGTRIALRIPLPPKADAAPAESKEVRA